MRVSSGGSRLPVVRASSSSAMMGTPSHVSVVASSCGAVSPPSAEVSYLQSSNSATKSTANLS